MKNLLLGLILLLTLACNQAKKQSLPKKIEKETITYFTYGELPPAGYVYYDTVFNMPKYAFKIKNMGGCEPIGVDYKNLEHRNKQTAQYMIKHFGKDWEKDFEEQTQLKIMLPLELED